MVQYPQPILQLIQSLRKFPGVGTKSAERFAFDLLNWPENQTKELAKIINDLKERVKNCLICGCLIEHETACIFCSNPRRDPSNLCVVAHAKDIYFLEQMQEYHGLYHVLGGLLSPLEDIGPSDLAIPKLKERLQDSSIQEIVFALDSTLEGDTTALYLKQELAHLPLSISRLAFGLPMGSSLDYVDGGTLARAFIGRRQF